MAVLAVASTRTGAGEQVRGPASPTAASDAVPRADAPVPATGPLSKGCASRRDDVSLDVDRRTERFEGAVFISRGARDADLTHAAAWAQFFPCSGALPRRTSRRWNSRIRGSAAS
jgi:hypothetical protein